MPRRSSVLFIAGGALILAGLIGAFLSGRPPGNDEVYVPAHLGALLLTETRQGASAAAEIQRLHDGTLPVASAAVARYGPAGEATLWVVAAATESDAARLVEAMGRAIGSGDSPFTPLDKDVIAGVTVYPLTGMGQEHIYFQAGRLALWLAADPGVADEARLAVVEAYR